MVDFSKGRRGKAIPDDAVITHAEEFHEDDFTLAFRDEFARLILDREDGWSETGFVSMDSRVHDFDFTLEVEVYLNRLKEAYGVDCSDVKHLNLYQVMRRCEQSMNKH